MSSHHTHHSLRRRLRRNKILLWRIWRRIMISVRSLIFKKPLYIILIRHGESVRNRIKPPGLVFLTEETREQHKEIIEVPDRLVSLTKKGQYQARQTGLWLLEHGFVPHTIYCSPYNRTRETKDEILQTWDEEEQQGIRRVYSDLLREKAVGYTFGMTEEEVTKAFPFYFEYLNKFGGYDTVPPGGDSEAQVSDRIEAFMLKYFSAEAGNTICIVTHGDPYAAFRAKLERWDPLHWPEIEDSPKHCGITVYEYDLFRDRYHLREYNTIAWDETKNFD